MVTAKNNLFDKELQENARYFKALAHPARLQILLYLAEIKNCITGDISEEIPLGRTTVNQHLKELKDAGLIIGHTEGVKVNYCLSAEKIEMVKKLTNELFSRIDSECDIICKIVQSDENTNHL